MATARVSGSHAQQGFDVSASARTLAYAGNLTSASTLIVAVALYNTGVTVTVSDGTNGSYTQVGAYSLSGDSAARVSLWILKNNSSTSAPTVTVTPSASAYVTFFLDEFTGMGANPTVHSSTNSSFTSNVPTGTVTASAGDLVVVGGCTEVSEWTGSTAPFLFSGGVASSGTIEGGAVAYHLSAAGNEACTFTGGSGTQIGAFIIASITPDAGGGGGDTGEWMGRMAAMSLPRQVRVGY